jgi:hypothetical protein
MKKFKIVILLFLLLVTTFIAFSPVLKNGFVNWDDDIYVTQNPMIRNLSLKNIRQIFLSTHYTVMYTPLVFISYAVEYHFRGLQPSFFHLTNLILHMLNCFLVFSLIYLLHKNAVVAFIVSVLFGIHPLHVESVAWISERKDLLYAFFFLWALICYIYYVQKKRPQYYFFVLILFVLALLSKPVAVVLPFILLFFDYFLTGGINKKNLLEKIPFLGIALFFLILVILTARTYIRIDPDITFLDKILIANYALVFYLYKIILPFGLSCLYPYPLKVGNFLPSFFLLPPLITMALYVLVRLSLKYTRKIFFGFGFFFILILPALQLFPTGPVIISDRYSYIPSIGIFFIIAESILFLYQKKIRHNHIFIISSFLVFIVIIGMLSILTWNRCKVWKNSFTLWNDAINNYPAGYIPLAYFNRGVTYLDKQDNKKAIFDFDKALMLYYKKLGMHQNYTSIYNKLLISQFGYSALYNFLGVKYAQINRMQEAEILLRRAIALHSSYVEAYVHLVAVYSQQGKYKEAITMGEKAVKLDQHAALAHYNLSVAYYFDNQCDLAFKHLEVAINLGFRPNPEFVVKLKKAH